MLNSTLNGVARAITGYLKKENTRFKERWEMHRELIVSIVKPNLKKEYKDKSVKELYPLAWDNKRNKTEAKEVDPKQFWETIDRKKEIKNK